MRKNDILRLPCRNHKQNLHHLLSKLHSPKQRFPMPLHRHIPNGLIQMCIFCGSMWHCMASQTAFSLFEIWPSQFQIGSPPASWRTLVPLSAQRGAKQKKNPMRKSPYPLFIWPNQGSELLFVATKPHCNTATSPDSSPRKQKLHTVKLSQTESNSLSYHGVSGQVGEMKPKGTQPCNTWNPRWT